ncbi:hypothetical protein RHS01_10853 [Rhizoctonia solani]|uniref:Uncharacterized protein n=1 Tax=Rhizoctonia solani TaxID=456999 RepID=A0A8H7M213_9AGAM|nr:hypothetical protein RHS01_10853 [Rhizoctonia solani]
MVAETLGPPNASGYGTLFKARVETGCWEIGRGGEEGRRSRLCIWCMKQHTYPDAIAGAERDAAKGAGGTGIGYAPYRLSDQG